MAIFTKGARALLLPFSAMIYGCQALTGISHEYPPHWPKIYEVSENECVDLSGSYGDFGMSGNHSTIGKENRLSFYFYKGVRKKNGDPVVQLTADEVEIVSSSETISVQVKRQEILVDEIKFEKGKGDFLCNGNGVTLDVTTTSQSGTYGGGVGSIRLRLSKAKDRSLVGETIFGGVGVGLWVVPVAGYQKLWYRWKEQ